MSHDITYGSLHHLGRSICELKKCRVCSGEDG